MDANIMDGITLDEVLRKVEIGALIVFGINLGALDNPFASKGAAFPATAETAPAPRANAAG